jgi:hypothetical protein
MSVTLIETHDDTLSVRAALVYVLGWLCVLAVGLASLTAIYLAGAWVVRSYGTWPIVRLAVDTCALALVWAWFVGQCCQVIGRER